MADIKARIITSPDRMAAVLDESLSYATKDYNKLNNKPQINGVELTGNKSFEDLGEHEMSAIEVINIWNSVFEEE